MIKNYTIGALAIVGFIAIVNLAIGNALGFVIGAAVTGALYYFGYLRLEKYDYETMKKVCLIIGVIGILSGFLSIIVGVFLGLISLVGGGLLLYIYQMIEKPKPPEPVPSPPTPITTVAEEVRYCPDCGQPLTWVAEYERWYCQNEKKYPEL